ncbi:hypothetical protein IAT40_005109 [Kwoniella sp. CBS 6097]
MGLRPSPFPSLATAGPGPPTGATTEDGLLQPQLRPRIRLRVQPALTQSQSSVRIPRARSCSPTDTHSTFPLSQSSLDNEVMDTSASVSGSGGPTPPTSPLPDSSTRRNRKRQRRYQDEEDSKGASLTGDIDIDQDMGSDTEYIPPQPRSTIIRIPPSASYPISPAPAPTSAASTASTSTLLRGGGKKPPRSRRSVASAAADNSGSQLSAAATTTSHTQKQTSTRRTTRSKARRASSPSDLITTSLEEIAIEDAAVKNEVARLGLCLRDVKGDGNCLFRVLSDQGFGGEKRHAEIRKLVCDYLESHKSVMEGFVVPFMKDGEGYEGYVARMRQLKQFGSHIEIQAAARVFKRNIRVVMSTTSFTIPWRTEAFPDVAATPTPSEVGPVHASSASTPLARRNRINKQIQLSPESLAQATSASVDYLPSAREDRGMLWLALFSQAEHFQSVRRMGDREHGPAEVEDRLAIPHERDVSEAARRERGELIDDKKKVPMSESSQLNQLFASLPPGHGISEEHAQGILSRVKGDIGEAVEILLEEIDQAVEAEEQTEGAGSIDGSSSSERVEGILSSPPQASPELCVHARDHALEDSPSEASRTGQDPNETTVQASVASATTATSMDRRVSDYRSHSRSKSKSTSPSNTHSTATTSTESRSLSLSISSRSESESRSRSNSAVSSFSSTDIRTGPDDGNHHQAVTRARSSVSLGSLKRKSRTSKTKEKELSHDLEGMGFLSEPTTSSSSPTINDQSMDIDMTTGVVRSVAPGETQNSLNNDVKRGTPTRVQRRERADRERRRSSRLGMVGA